MTTVQIYKRRFFDSSIADILRAIQGGSLLGAFVLTVCSIGALSEVHQNGTYVKNKEPERTILDTLLEFLPRILQDFFAYQDAEKRFASTIYRNWVRRYFKKAGVSDPHEWYLYAVRCALVHTYGFSDELARQKQSGYSLRHNEPNLHWTKRKHTKTSGFTPGYIINLDSLVAQYIVAAFKFFDEMDTLIEKEKQIVVKRLEKLIDIYDPDDSGDPSKRIEEPKSFKGMHGVLKECDSANPQTEEIRKAICSLFPN